MQATHTPGPWAYRTHPNDPAFEHIASDRGAIIAKPLRMGSPGVMAANAQLMGAAPAMLAALQRADALLHELRAHELDSAEDRETMAAVAAAIALATGTPTVEAAFPIGAYASTVSDADYREIVNGRKSWPLASATGEGAGNVPAETIQPVCYFPPCAHLAAQGSPETGNS